MSETKAVIIKHSKCPRGHELITFELTFARFLLAELNTHRMFSKNSASSRAIPFKKMVEMVKTNAFVPSAFQREHKGMQGTEYLTDPYEISNAEESWLNARDAAVIHAEYMNNVGLTKQLCNRLLEPFMWHKVVLTTGLEGLRNFFELRCPQYKLGIGIFKSKKEAIKVTRIEHGELVPPSIWAHITWLEHNKGQAEIHMMELAEQMYDAYNESVPQLLKEGEWHAPYEELIDLSELAKLLSSNLTIPSDYYDVECEKDLDSDSFYKIWLEPYVIKASTGMLARASYITVGDDKVPSIETLIGIHDKMVNARPKHSSPMEHCSQVMTEEEYYLFSKGMDGQKDHEHGWCYNYRGFKNYRYILDMTSQS